MKKKLKIIWLEIRATILFYIPAIFRIKELLHYESYTKGLWAVDADPKTKSKEWIDDNAFQID